MGKIGRIFEIMTTAVKQKVFPRRTNRHKSPYALFIVQRNNYGKRQKKSMVGTTMVVRPSWGDKKNEGQEE